MSLTAEQQQVRRRGIGGSEIAAVAGLNPWMSPLDVYLRKKNLVVEAANHNTERGTFFEPSLLNWYAHRTGRELVMPGTLQLETNPLVIATPDAQAGKDLDRRGVEAKMPGRFNFKEWGTPGTDEVPDYYIPQCQWEAAVLHVHVVDVVTLLDDDLAIYPVRFDRELFGALVDIAERFWREHIMGDNPPPPNGSERAREWLLSQHPKATLPLLNATEEMLALATEYSKAREIEKQAGEAKDLAGNRLRALLKDHAGAQGAGLSLSYKNNKDSTTTNWAAIVSELNVPDDIIARHTHTRPGARVLRVTLKD